MNLFDTIKSSTRIRRAWSGKLQPLAETPRTLLVPEFILTQFLESKKAGWPTDVEPEPWEHNGEKLYICNRYPDVSGGYKITRSLLIEQDDFVPFSELKKHPL